MVDAWQRLAPVEVEAETRADRRIMPVLQVVGSSPERERGMLFGGLVDDRPRVADLPLFPELEPTRYRVPLLEIVDATGVPLRSRGRGAPIEARLIVRGGLMMIRPEDRGRTTVRIAVTVGELLDGLYPTKRRIAQNWPKIEAALLTARDFTVPDATGGRWFPMALRRLPAERLDGAPPALDDLVVVDLAPPPGATTGPSVDLPALDLMGVSSGPDWYAYIAARSLIWRPRKDSAPGAAAARLVRLEHRSRRLPGAHPGRPAPLRVRRTRLQAPNSRLHPEALVALARCSDGSEPDRHAHRYQWLSATARGGKKGIAQCYNRGVHNRGK